MKLPIQLFLVVFILLGIENLSAQWTDGGSYLNTNDNVNIGATSNTHSLYVRKDNSAWQARFANRAGAGADVYLAHGSGYGMHVRGYTTDGKYTLSLYNKDGMTNEFYNNGIVALGMRGNVGIGTSSPEAKLDVRGKISVGQPSGYRGDSNQNYAVHYFATGTNGSSPTLIHPAGRTYGGYAGNSGWGGQKLVFEAANNWSTFVDHQLVLRGNGNILIGSANEKWTDIPETSKSRLYVKNDNDEMIAFERTGVGHIYEFRMGGDGKLVLGRRWGGSNGSREIVMEFESASSNKRVEFKSHKIYAKEIEVNNNGAADYVFEKDYDLMPLEEVHAFVQQNHHLPNFPKGDEYDKSLEIGSMTIKLIEKLEELTLYTIEQEKRIKALEAALLDKKQ